MNGLDFIIDKLTNSIERRDTRESQRTSIVMTSAKEIGAVHKKDGWSFNWKKEFKLGDRQLYKLTLEGDNKIQGLISLEPRPHDKYIEMHLIECAPHNLGCNREFIGVAGNMVAFGCRMSFELGFEGYVCFTAKTKLIDHYIKTLGAQVLNNTGRMTILPTASKILVSSYYHGFFNDK